MFIKISYRTELESIDTAIHREHRLSMAFKDIDCLTALVKVRHYLEGKTAIQKSIYITVTTGFLFINDV